jgi:hypothetical protein
MGHKIYRTREIKLIFGLHIPEDKNTKKLVGSPPPLPHTLSLHMLMCLMYPSRGQYNQDIRICREKNIHSLWIEMLFQVFFILGAVALRKMCTEYATEGMANPVLARDRNLVSRYYGG